VVETYAGDGEVRQDLLVVTAPWTPRDRSGTIGAALADR
jgi:hypothetical protein